MTTIDIDYLLFLKTIKTQIMLQLDEKIINHNVILAKKKNSLTEPGVHQFLVSQNSIENYLFHNL